MKNQTCLLQVLYWFLLLFLNDKHKISQKQVFLTQCLLMNFSWFIFCLVLTIATDTPRFGLETNSFWRRKWTWKSASNEMKKKKKVQLIFIVSRSKRLNRTESNNSGSGRVPSREYRNHSIGMGGGGVCVGGNWF